LSSSSFISFLPKPEKYKKTQKQHKTSYYNETKRLTYVN
jgi:hypothetical protein